MRFISGFWVAIPTLTVFLSAYLLFMVQPLLTKAILPTLGGSPYVWNTVITCFQLLLLAGYYAAHRVLMLTRLKTQLMLYAAIIGISLFYLPLAISLHDVVNASNAPVRWIVIAVALSVLAPFFLLSTTNTLVQGWFAKTQHARSSNPHFLYAASNAGSLLALLMFPFVLEPVFTLDGMQRVWSIGFVVFVVCMALSCILFTKHRAPQNISDLELPSSITPPLKLRLYWIALAFVPSGLMVSTTSHITTDIASAPLLWIIPLALYLLTFILAFTKRQPGLDNAIKAQVTLILVSVLLLIVKLPFLPILELFCLYAVCYSCHGLLARNKPETNALGIYYLCISIGGALGGFFCSMIAPMLFNSIVEYPFFLFLACLLRPNMIQIEDRKKALRMDVVYPIFGLIVLGYLGVIRYSTESVQLFPEAWQVAINAWLATIKNPLDPSNSPSLNHLGAIAMVVFIVALVGFFYKRTVSYAIVIGFLLASNSFDLKKSDVTTLHKSRSFFGVAHVYKTGEEHFFKHGTTLHGRQSLNQDMRLKLVSYYGPLEEMYKAQKRGTTTRPIALAGLGTGVALCLGKGLHFDVYEIDPDVINIAKNPAYFTYVQDCPSVSHFILGDARLNLAKTPNEHYGMIILDTFTSDAIPIHIITNEAVAMYLSKLEADGLLVVHISNRFFDLRKLLAGIAEQNHVVAYFKSFPGSTEKLLEMSEWVVITKNESKALEKQGWLKLQSSDVLIWTDQYSNLLPFLK
jgi:hypothetical protein